MARVTKSGTTAEKVRMKMKPTWQKKLEINSERARVRNEMNAEHRKERSMSYIYYRESVHRKEGDPLEFRERVYHGDTIISFAGVKCYLD